MNTIFDRVREWLDSDLVGVAVTLAAAAVFGLAVVGFILAGPVGGVLFAVLSIGLVVMIVAQPGRKVGKPR